MDATEPLKSGIESYEVIWPYELPDPTEFAWLQIQNETSCITSWYYELLRSQLRGATPRLFIDLNPKLRSRRKLIAPSRITTPFHYEKYLQLDVHAKKVHVATTLRDTLCWFAEKTNQDQGPVEAAFATMQESAFCFVGELRQHFKDPSGKLSATIGFEYDINGAQMVVRFRKTGGKAVLTEKAIGLCPPHPWLLNSFHRSVSWSETRLSINFAGLFRRSISTGKIARMTG